MLFKSLRRGMIVSVFVEVAPFEILVVEVLVSVEVVVDPGSGHVRVLLVEVH